MLQGRIYPYNQYTDGAELPRTKYNTYAISVKLEPLRIVFWVSVVHVLIVSWGKHCTEPFPLISNEVTQCASSPVSCSYSQTSPEVNCSQSESMTGCVSVSASNMAWSSVELLSAMELNGLSTESSGWMYNAPYRPSSI